MITLKVASIRAAIECSATKDVRYYLNGIQVQVREDKTVRVRSTNGSIAFEDQMQDLAQCAECSIIIPLETAKLIAKLKQSTVELLPLEDGKYSCGNFIFTPIDGLFPDMDRVMPKRESSHGERGYYYNPDLLARCQKAMRIATGKMKASFRLQYGSCALMHREVEAFPRCAIMALNENRAFQNN